MQRLAEAHTGLEQPRLGVLVGLEQVLERQVSPELADATGHAVGVVVEFLLLGERNHLAIGGSSEPLQIECLAADDGVEALPDPLLIYGGKLVEAGNG